MDYFVWLPTVDHQAPAPDKLAFGVAALEFFASRKIKIYIHCQHGHGQAPTLYAAYLIKGGMGVNEAISFLQSKRPAVHLSDAQISALEKFKTSLRV